MDKVIVYVDDAAYAQQVLGPLFAKSTQGASAARTQWVLVACAPRMTHRISKWVSHSARENWRTKWADKLFAQIVPLLRAPAGSVTTVLAKGPLNELTDQLQAAQEGGAAQVVDARRPKTDAATEPQRPERRWPSPRPGTLLSSLLTTGFGALWVLALD